MSFRRPRIGASSRGLWVLALALVCLVGTQQSQVSAAPEPPPDPFNVKSGKKPKGPWSGGPMQSGIVDIQLKPGAFRNVYLRIRSTTDTNEKTKLEQLAVQDPSDYRIRWFRGKKEITSKVKGPMYGLRLKARKTKVVRVRIKAKQEPGPLCLGGQFRLVTETTPFADAAYFQVNSNSACN